MSTSKWLDNIAVMIDALNKGLQIESACNENGEWTTYTGEGFQPDKVYRIKRTARYCNGHLLKDCLTKLVDRTMFMAAPHTTFGYCATHTTNLSVLELADLLEWGMLYDSSEAAAIHGIAMRYTLIEGNNR